MTHTLSLPALVLPPQMRVQVHNLQSLQDALTEEKLKTKTLAEQKRELKDRIADVETQLTELETQSATAMSDVQSQLQHSAALVQSLQVENEELRHQLLTAVNTPPPVPAPGVGGNEVAVLPSHRDEELFEKVKFLEQELLESNSHSNSLENSLQQKSKQLEFLTQEIGILRSNVTEMTDELNRIKSEKIRNEVSLEAQLLEKEHEVNESSQQLKDFLLIFKENEVTNEEFISQLQQQIASLSSQLEQTKEAKLSSDAKNFLLDKQLSDAEERIRQLELFDPHHDHHRHRHEAEGGEVEEGVGGDRESVISVIRSREREEEFVTKVCTSLSRHHSIYLPPYLPPSLPTRPPYRPPTSSLPLLRALLKSLLTTVVAVCCRSKIVIFC
jgi:chromosome segregation ATPase